MPDFRISRKRANPAFLSQAALTLLAQGVVLMLGASSRIVIIRVVEPVGQGEVAGAALGPAFVTLTGWELSDLAGLIPLRTPTALPFVTIGLLIPLLTDIRYSAASPLEPVQDASPISHL